MRLDVCSYSDCHDNACEGTTINPQMCQLPGWRPGLIYSYVLQLLNESLYFDARPPAPGQTTASIEFKDARYNTPAGKICRYSPMAQALLEGYAPCNAVVTPSQPSHQCTDPARRRRVAINYGDGRPQPISAAEELIAGINLSPVSVSYTSSARGVCSGSIYAQGNEYLQPQR